MQVTQLEATTDAISPVHGTFSQMTNMMQINRTFQLHQIGAIFNADGLTASSANEGVMETVLVSAIRESCGYLQDEGWHQTAQLMTLAAHEIERLTERVRELETRANPGDYSEGMVVHGSACHGQAGEILVNQAAGQ